MSSPGFELLLRCLEDEALFHSQEGGKVVSQALVENLSRAVTPGKEVVHPASFEHFEIAAKAQTALEVLGRKDTFKVLSYE